MAVEQALSRCRRDTNVSTKPLGDRVAGLVNNAGANKCQYESNFVEGEACPTPSTRLRHEATRRDVASTLGTRLAVIRSDPKQNQAAMEEGTMRGILLWLIGIPIPIIILLWLFGVLH